MDGIIVAGIALIVAVLTALGTYLATNIKSIGLSQAAAREIDIKTENLRVEREQDGMQRDREMRAKFDKMDAKYDDLEKDYRTVVARQMELTDNLAISRGEYDKLRIAFTKQEMTIEALRKEVDNLNALSKQASEELTTERDARKAEADTHASDRADWIKVVEELKTQIVDLKKEIVDLRETIKAYQKHTNIAPADIEQVESEDDEPQADAEIKPAA